MLSVLSLVCSRSSLTRTEKGPRFPSCGGSRFLASLA